MPKLKKRHRRSTSKKENKIQLSPRKKRIFTILMVMIPVIFFGLSETGLRLFRYGGNLDLFVPTPDESSDYLGINLNIGSRYFPKGTFNPTPRKDLFLKKRPENGYRVFVLGGSTAAGFPYGNNITFARILNRRLSDTFPDRRIEVVNMAMTAINSNTLLDFMDEILEQKPDALLIYAGHNEFYGALGAGSVESLGNSSGVIKIYLKLQRFRIFILMRNVIQKIQHKNDDPPDKNKESDLMETAMSRIVKQNNIDMDSKIYRSGEQTFRNNLNGILKKSKEAGIPVVISELVSNVRDQKPFIAREGDTLSAAGKAFIRARDLEKKNKFSEAQSAYYEAKDLDGLRFRAPETFNEIIHQLAGEYNIPVVPMKSIFEKASPNGLIGKTLICDHLHPNEDGYFLMADAFYNTLKAYQFIEPEWPIHNEHPGSYYHQHWGMTALDSAYAALTITHLKGGWPFQNTGPNRALERFKPACKEDSIALNILKTGQSTLEMGHIELGRFYERQGRPEQAFREYKALVYTVPNLDLFYEPALNILLSHQQYEQALDFMMEGLKTNSSAFMLKWIGQLNLALGETSNGIDYLEQARLKIPDDSQLLFNLVRANYTIRQIKRGDQLLDQLRGTVPESIIQELVQYRQSMLESH